MKKLIGYIRVSSDIQVQKGVSLEEQTETIQKWCKDHNYIVDLIYDKGQSGKKENYKLREGYNKIWRDIDNYDGLIVASFNRLGRSFYGLLEDIEKLSNMKKEFISIRENITDISSPTGKLIINIFSAIAQFQIENMREARYAGYKYLFEHPESKKIGKKNIGHPRKEISSEVINDLKNGVKKEVITKKYNISLPTLNLRLKEMKSG